jgi:hypothetical protein
MPAVGSTGSLGVTGSLILGVGTQANNALKGTGFSANTSAQFQTNLNTHNYTNSFIDSGSNGLYFQASGVAGLTPCGTATGFWCPASTLALGATQAGTSGSPSAVVNFSVGNFETLFTNGNYAYNNTAGDDPGAGFDWGLPFFYGRDVFTVIDGSKTTLGVGRFWVY